MFLVNARYVNFVKLLGKRFRYWAGLKVGRQAAGWVYLQVSRGGKRTALAPKLVETKNLSSIAYCCNLYGKL